jgi:hypothetical protein
MTCRPAAARTIALLAGLAAAGGTHAACLEFASRPDGAVLVHVATPLDDPTFTLTYVHSVTRTPVVERYRIDDATIVQTEIGFEQHGPGLPTQADHGGRFERRDGRFVVTMERRFDVIVMRVHADQSPRLAAGGRTIDLAAWGSRALALRAQAGVCAAG